MKATRAAINWAMDDFGLSIGVPSSSPAAVTKKAGAAEHPTVFDRAGLLI
jgi:hypothetical protein